MVAILLCGVSVISIGVTGLIGMYLVDNCPETRRRIVYL